VLRLGILLVFVF